jgi:excisionase family DNA binding protein
VRAPVRLDVSPTRCAAFVQTSLDEKNDDGQGATRAPALLLTVPQAAQVLAIGRSTAYELIAAGDLEVVHIGRSVRVPVRALEDYVGRLRAGRGSSVTPPPPSVPDRRSGRP